MSGMRDFDDVLREWVDYGDERLPHHNLQAALVQIETTPQHGARSALLEGILMRIQPFAVPLAIAATLVVAVAAFALATRPPSVGPEPTETPVATATLPPPAAATGEFATTEFAIPLTVQLPAAPDPGGWLVTDTGSLLGFAATDSDLSRLLILDPAQTRVVDQDGAPAPMPDDLAAWLDEQAGIAAERLEAFDVGGPATYDVAGQPTPVYEATFDVEAAGGRTLLETAEGFALAAPEEPALWWLMPFESEEGDLLVIYVSSTETPGFGGSYLDIAASIKLR